MKFYRMLFNKDIYLFVDHQLKPLVPQISSYVKDTNDFLNKLKDMDRFPEGAILVTIDIVDLFPHISHNEGLHIQKILNMRTDQEIPTDDIVDLAEFLRIATLNVMLNIFYKSMVQLLAREWCLPMLIYLCTTLNHSYWTWLQLSPFFGLGTLPTFLWSEWQEKNNFKSWLD